MDRVHSPSLYTSRVIKDDEQGFIGMELFVEKNGTTQSVASVIYWDAVGQFSVNIIEELPLTILEALIEEAKKLIN